jgi:hypothetical protein
MSDSHLEMGLLILTVHIAYGLCENQIHSKFIQIFVIEYVAHAEQVWGWGGERMINKIELVL